MNHLSGSGHQRCTHKSYCLFPNYLRIGFSRSLRELAINSGIHRLTCHEGHDNRDFWSDATAEYFVEKTSGIKWEDVSACNCPYYDKVNVFFLWILCWTVNILFVEFPAWKIHCSHVLHFKNLIAINAIFLYMFCPFRMWTISKFLSFVTQSHLIFYTIPPSPCFSIQLRLLH